MLITELIIGADAYQLPTDTGTVGQVLVLQSGAQALDWETISVLDNKVGVDAAATAGYLGIAYNDGVLRTDTSLDYADGGDYVTISLNSTLKANYDAASAHVSANGSSHTYIDQAVTIAGTPTFAGLTITNAITEFSTDGTLAGDSDSALPTEKAVKTYVDAQVSAEDFWDRDSSGIIYPKTVDDNLQLGDSTVDTGTFTMIKGAQSGDPQVQMALSADALGDFSITTDTGDLSLISGAGIALTASGDNVTVTATTLSTLATNIAMGMSLVDCGTLTMVKGGQSGDPQVQFALSADANGDFSITTDTGDIILQAAATTEVVVNESGIDADFRVETSTVTEAFVIDAGNDTITFGVPVGIGSMNMTEDGGAMELVDMSVTASPVAGTEESYSFKIDTTTLLTVYAEADSAGGIQNPEVKVGTAAFSVAGTEIVGSDGVVNAAAIEDKFLRNDASDTTSGDITANGFTDGTATLTGGSLTAVKLGTLTTNGFVKTSASDGTLSVDTNTYLQASDNATITGAWTFNTILPQSTLTATSANQLTNKAYVDSVVAGLGWQEPVISRQTDPPSSGLSDGDRYLVIATAGGAWAGQEEDIAIYIASGGSWEFTTPEDGWALYVEDENLQYIYSDKSGAPGDWYVFSSGTSSHNALAGLEGGAVNEYYHLTTAEYAALDTETLATVTARGADTSTAIRMNTETKLYFGSATNAYIQAGGTNPYNNLTFNASSGNVYIKPSQNVYIGQGAVGIDYRIIFDGQNNDGNIIWMEDENYFEMTPYLKLASGTPINEFSIDGTLAGDSDDAVPTEKAVKTYVDAAITAEDFWDRDSSGYLYPKTSGDDITLSANEYLYMTEHIQNTDTTTNTIIPLLTAFDGTEDGIFWERETGATNTKKIITKINNVETFWVYLYENTSTYVGVMQGNFTVNGSLRATTSISGSGSASGNLTFTSTSHATKGNIYFGEALTAYYDELNAKLQLPSGTSVNEFSTDGTLIGNSDDAVPTEQAVKTYVDAQITTEDFWDRSSAGLITTNTPGDDVSLGGTLDVSGVITVNSAYSFPTSTGTYGQVLKLQSGNATLDWADDNSDTSYWDRDSSGFLNPATDGDTLRVYDSIATQYIDIEADGSDINFDFNAAGIHFQNANASWLTNVYIDGNLNGAVLYMRDTTGGDTSSIMLWMDDNIFRINSNQAVNEIAINHSAGDVDFNVYSDTLTAFAVDGELGGITFAGAYTFPVVTGTYGQVLKLQSGASVLAWEDDTTLSYWDRSSVGLLTTNVANDDLQLDGYINWDAGNVWYVPLTGDIETYIASATSGDTLVLAAGTYTITSDITVAKSINIVGQGIGHTIINATTAIGDFFDISDGSYNVRLADFSMTSNSTGGNEAVYTEQMANLTLENISINYVASASSAGQINVGQVSGKVILRNVVSVSTSTAGANNSGGIYVWADDANTIVEMYDCHFEGTGKGGSFLGYFQEWGSGSVTVYGYDTTFALTEVGAAGASYAIGIDGPDVTCNFTRCSFDGYTNSGDYDIENYDGTCNLTDCVLVNNSTNGTITYLGTVGTKDLLLENGALIANKQNTDIDAGTETVDTFADTAGDAVSWTYLVKKGANLRAGTIVACWDASGNTTEYTETHTNDIGDTSVITFDVDINSDNVRLLATATSGETNWIVRVVRTLI